MALNLHARLISATLALAAAATSASAQTYVGALSAERRAIQVEDRLEQAPGELRVTRRFLDGQRVLFESVSRMQSDSLIAEIRAGHPSQIGRIELNGTALKVSDASGAELWKESLTRPLCMPELFGEFIRASWTELASPGDSLLCVSPIIKARKVAPIRVQRLPDRPDGRRQVEVGPGSLGMRLFLSPTVLEFAKDGNALLAQRGQFESTPDPARRASYLKGELRFDPPRPVLPLPARR